MKLLLAAIVVLAFSVGAMAQDPGTGNPPPTAGGDAVNPTGDQKPADAKKEKAEKKHKKHGKKKAPKDS